MGAVGCTEKNVSFVACVVDEFVLTEGGVQVKFRCFVVLAMYDHARWPLFEVGDGGNTVCVVFWKTFQMLFVLVPLLLHVLVPCCGQD